MQKVIKKIDKIRPADYDAKAGHPMQSYAWGEAKKKTGVRVARFGVYENGVLKHVYQMTVHKLPNIPRYVAYVPRSGLPDESVITYLHSWAKREKIIFIKWEPYVESKEGQHVMSALAHVRRSKHPLFTNWNQELDLTPSEEDLLKNCKEKTRYCIRLAERKGVEVKEMSSDEGFKIFCDLYFATCKRQGYRGHTRAYHKMIWETLAPLGIAKIFIAFYQGRPLAAYEVFLWHDRVYYPYGGTADTDRNVPAAQLLMWRITQEGKRLGKSVYDMWGSLAPDNDGKHPWNGFTYFKRGYGTRFVEMMPSYDHIIDPVLYPLYSTAHKIRKFLWRSGLAG